MSQTKRHLPPAAAGTLWALVLLGGASPAAAQRFQPNVYVSALAGPAVVTRALVTGCDIDTGTQTSVSGELLAGVRLWSRLHVEASGTVRTPISTFCPSVPPATPPDDGTVVQDSFPGRTSLLGSAQLRLRWVPARGGYSVAVGGGWLEPQGALVTSASFLQFFGGTVQFGFGGTLTGVRVPCQEVRRTYEGGALVDTQVSDQHCWRAMVGARLGVVLPMEIVSRRAARRR